MLQSNTLLIKSAYTPHMRSLIDELEAWREARGLTKTDMAKKLGAPAPQYYTNWVYRDSLPKAYIEKAQALLGKPEPEYENSPFAALSEEEKREVVLQLLGELDGESRAAALRFLLRKSV